MEVEECFRRRLLVKVPADYDSARRSLSLARCYIVDAEKSRSLDSNRLVIITSYTAMFHAARAILFHEGVKERSHECIPLFVRDRYPALYAYTNMLDSYRKSRHEAIYGLDFNPGKQDAITAIEVAREFLSAVENVLTDL